MFSRRKVLAAICTIPILGLFCKTEEHINEVFVEQDIVITKPTRFHKCRFVDCSIDCIDDNIPIEISNCEIMATGKRPHGLFVRV